MAASSLHHEKSYLGDKYRRLRTKLGAPKAITVMAHQIARIIWHLITHRVPFDMSIFAAFEQANQKRHLNRLHAAARQMGYQLTQIADEAMKPYPPTTSHPIPRFQRHA